LGTVATAIFLLFDLAGVADVRGRDFQWQWFGLAPFAAFSFFVTWIIYDRYRKIDLDVKENR